MPSGESVEVARARQCYLAPHALPHAIFSQGVTCGHQRAVDHEVLVQKQRRGVTCPAPRLCAPPCLGGHASGDGPRKQRRAQIHRLSCDHWQMVGLPKAASISASKTSLQLASLDSSPQFSWHVKDAPKRFAWLRCWLT